MAAESSKKTVLITGGAQGIGAGIAQAFAAKNYNIALNDLEESSAFTETKNACEKLGADVLPIFGSVTDFELCKNMAQQVVDQWQKIDVLVNNAGITRDGLLLRMKEAQFADVINTNLQGAFNMLRHVSPFMLKARQGSIINISSITGLRGNAGQVNYTAAKAGLVGLSKSAAKELGGRNIRVNVVAPGFIETAMTEVLPDKMKKQVQEEIALKRIGTSEDVAKAVLWLASNDANYITGQVLCVDGGLAM